MKVLVADSLQDMVFNSGKNGMFLIVHWVHLHSLFSPLISDQVIVVTILLDLYKIELQFLVSWSSSFLFAIVAIFYSALWISNIKFLHFSLCSFARVLRSLVWTLQKVGSNLGWSCCLISKRCWCCYCKICKIYLPFSGLIEACWPSEFCTLC